MMQARSMLSNNQSFLTTSQTVILYKNGRTVWKIDFLAIIYIIVKNALIWPQNLLQKYHYDNLNEKYYLISIYFVTF